MGKNEWKNLFYFSKADRRVLLLLCGILLGFAVSSVFYHFAHNSQKENQTDSIGRSTYEAFVRQIEQNSNETSKTDDDRQTTYRYEQEKTISPETFYFDPNTADSTALKRLGLSPWQIRNIYKYRARGGRYHRPEDFSRLYGLTKGDYDRLRPYIRIAEKYQLMSDLQPSKTDNTENQPFHQIHQTPRQEKFPEGTRIELNSADTTALKKIPGIGSYYARQIIRYKEQLGGFASLSQLKEIKGLPENIERWFTISGPVFRKIKINRLSTDQLRKHPYLNFYQSKIITEHRRKYGPIKDIKALSLYEEFTTTDLERLMPYLSFEE